jgi:hypothetical protein
MKHDAPLGVPVPAVAVNVVKWFYSHHVRNKGPLTISRTKQAAIKDLVTLILVQLA